jgi:predicted RNA polymerase sigma factor
LIEKKSLCSAQEKYPDGAVPDEPGAFLLASRKRWMESVRSRARIETMKMIPYIGD